MRNFVRGLDALTKAMMILTAFCAFGIAFMILVEVTSRNLGIRFYGAAEYIRNLLIVIVFLQLPYAVRIRSMLVVDIFVGSLPQRLGIPVAVAGHLLGAFFFGAVALGSFHPAVEAWVEGQYEGEGVVDVPAWPAKFSIVIGCGIAAFYYLVRIVEALRSGRLGNTRADAPAAN
jgi:TRAP-type C4-dicarboxylate transport system permease small subunit